MELADAIEENIEFLDYKNFPDFVKDHYKVHNFEDLGQFLFSETQENKMRVSAINCEVDNIEGIQWTMAGSGSLPFKSAYDHVLSDVRWYYNQVENNLRGIILRQNFTNIIKFILKEIENDDHPFFGFGLWYELIELSINGFKKVPISIFLCGETISGKIGLIRGIESLYCDGWLFLYSVEQTNNRDEFDLSKHLSIIQIPPLVGNRANPPLISGLTVTEQQEKDHLKLYIFRKSEKLVYFYSHERYIFLESDNGWLRYEFTSELIDKFRNALDGLTA